MEGGVMDGGRNRRRKEGGMEVEGRDGWRDRWREEGWMEG